jgi:pimeloyl-ACP methyl ester carboxylesterase
LSGVKTMGSRLLTMPERCAREIPETRLVRIKPAGHIPMENDPKVAGALAGFFAAERK